VNHLWPEGHQQHQHPSAPSKGANCNAWHFFLL
jgi:hypothetical protein